MVQIDVWLVMIETREGTKVEKTGRRITINIRFLKKVKRRRCCYSSFSFFFFHLFVEIHNTLLMSC